VRGKRVERLGRGACGGRGARQLRVSVSSAAEPSPPRRSRADGLAHAAGTSRTNLAAALDPHVGGTGDVRVANRMGMDPTQTGWVCQGFGKPPPRKQTQGNREIGS
jgi:hypothetical protein